MTSIEDVIRIAAVHDRAERYIQSAVNHRR